MSAQDTHRTLAGLAHALGLDPAAIRVVLPDVGGAFGSKGTPGPEVAAVAAAALRLGRPVKWMEDRLENFLAAYQGRGMEADVELALDAAGQHARRARADRRRPRRVPVREQRRAVAHDRDADVRLLHDPGRAA